jgi:hypothetical protein
MYVPQAFLSDEGKIERIVVLLQKIIDKIVALLNLRHRHLLQDVTDDVVNRALNDLGTAEPDIYLLYGAMLAASGANIGVVRMYLLKANSAQLLLDSGSTVTSVIQIDEEQNNETDIERSAKEEQAPPGELIYSLPDDLNESQVTDLYAGLQSISLNDDIKYSSWSSSRRRRAIEKDVLALVATMGLPAVPNGRKILQSDVSTDGTINSGIYYPDSTFRKDYAKKLARTAPLDVDDVTISLVTFVRLPSQPGFASSTAYTARLQNNRCFLCDRRNPYSSETDSEKHSKSTKLSEESSSQKNFRDSARFACQRNGLYRFGGYDYSIAFSQFAMTMSCKTCGWFVTTCPKHERQKAKYEEEAHIKWTFTGTKEVEASKKLGGKKVVDPYDVPNKKVYYQKHGAPAPKDEFEKKVVKIDGAKIIIPIKD